MTHWHAWRVPGAGHQKSFPLRSGAGSMIGLLLGTSWELSDVDEKALLRLRIPASMKNDFNSTSRAFREEQ